MEDTIRGGVVADLQEMAVAAGPDQEQVAVHGVDPDRMLDGVADVVVGDELRIAPRRSEHVACAGGADVTAARELFCDPSGVRIAEASNLSTGFCPEPACWEALAAALDRAGIARPPQLTHAFEFRRCTACLERNVIKDGDFTCAICDEPLPAAWNFDWTRPGESR